MCINPATLRDGTTFGCRKCWQCRENRIQDWVGRCIAQTKTSTVSRSITLTYGNGDHPAAAVLTYSDVQKYFKRLRKAGYQFRYLVAGEYGSVKGRAHWHAILFFDGEAPPHDLRTNYADEYWTHGHVFYDECSPKAVRYVCKYILKSEDDAEYQGVLRMSKRPPIGRDYFRTLAAKHVANGVSPRDLKYSFRENVDKEGQPVQHYMHGVTADDFLATFIDLWRNANGNDSWPNSTLVEEYLDKKAQLIPKLALERRQYGMNCWYKPKEECVLRFSEAHNTTITSVGGVDYYWQPLRAQEIQGEWVWREKNGRTIQYSDSEAYKLQRERNQALYDQATRAHKRL